MRGFLPVIGVACLMSQSTQAIDLNPDNEESIKEAASTIAFGLVKYYTGNNTGDVPGNLPDPYFWWEAGAMFGTLVDYWFLTGDDSYNNITTQALLHQTGDDRDFMPPNQTRTLGNDDQGFWAMAAMSAAENKFPDPPEDQPQWLSLVQAVFNEYASRWDEQNCGGGLRWQIFTFNNGFDYKNSISNGCFFNVAARLARFTGNATYASWAAKIFQWEVDVDLITPEFAIYDGLRLNQADPGNCSDHDLVQWTYNAGIYLHGAAVLYNLTAGDGELANPAQATIWRQRVDGLLNHTRSSFFTNDTQVMFEPACEPRGLCNVDQRSFKSHLTRWLAGTAQMAPQTASVIGNLLRRDAAAAALACSGSPTSGFSGHPGTACGLSWTGAGGAAAFDGNVGVGEQMNALSAVMYSLVGVGDTRERAPVTASTGGTSRGDPQAGSQWHPPTQELTPITTTDRVTAGFLTSAIVLSVIGSSVMMIK